MTPDKDMGLWTGIAAMVGGVVTNVDMGIRTLLLTAAAALIALLLGFGYNSMMNTLADIKTEFRTGQHDLRAENCANYDKVDGRLRNLEAGQAEVKTLVVQHLNDKKP